MKKNVLLTTLATISTSLAMVASAGAVSTEVLTLDADQDANGVINYSGTTDDGVLAVACSLYDATGEEVRTWSTEVDTAAFAGTLTEEVADYTLKCANYDGGMYVSAVIAAPEIIPDDEEEESEEADASKPETGAMTNEEGASASSNTAILPIVITTGIIAVAGVVFAVIKNKSKK